jgi:hypothetical protein
MYRATGATLRRGGLQCLVPPGSRIRSRRRAGAGYPTRHCQRCRTRRTHHRVHYGSRFLRPYNGRNQPGPAVPDRICGILRGSGNPRAVAERCTVPLVPVERIAGRPAADINEHWALQRTAWRLVTISHILKRMEVRRPCCQPLPRVLETKKASEKMKRYYPGRHNREVEVLSGD